MKEYKEIVNKVLNYGINKDDRTNTGTLSYFGLNYQIKNKPGVFPILTTKEISFKNIVIETLWFISGDDNIDLLKKHNCKFWDPWVVNKGKIPSPYGYFWRNFNGVDQIKYLIEQLRSSPESRRMVMSAWDPVNATKSKLPPCHILTVLNESPRGVVNLHLTQRSADVALGVPYNIAGYNLLLEILCWLGSSLDYIKIPGIFNHTLVDAHIYNNHIDGLKEQIKRTEKPLPKIIIDKDKLNISLDDTTDIKLNKLQDFIRNADTDEIMQVFRLQNYNPHGKINFKVAV